MNMRIHNQSATGQSMGEYSLAIALVAVLSIPAMQLLGNNLSLNVSGLLPRYTKPAIAAAPASNAGKPAALAPNSAGTGTAITSPDTLKVRLADGTMVSLNVPVDIPKSIMTIGANGTTKLMASSMEALAKQLLAEGKIDEAGSNAIVKLANLAHRQASIATLVDNAMAQGGSSTQAVMAQKVEFEGKTYNLSELAGQISTGTANPDGSYPYGPEAAPFWQAYQELWPAGAMKDTTAAGIIDTYVHEIANLSDSNRVVIYKMNNGGGETPDSYRQAQADYLKSIGFSNTATMLSTKTGAEVTHLDSASICGTGGKQDSGTHCSG